MGNDNPITRARRPAFFLKLIIDLIALALFIIGIVLLVFNGNGLDSDLTQFAGLGLLFYSVLIISLSLTLTYATNLQGSKEGCINGKRALTIAIIFLIAVTIFEIVIGALTAQMAADWSAVHDDLKKMVAPTVEKLLDNEGYVARVFNDIYFSLSTTCSSGTDFFWDFVNQNCDPDIADEFCRGCSYYSVTFCPVNSFHCDAQNDQGFTCAYQHCREPIMNFAVNFIAIPAAGVSLGIAFLHAILLVYHLPILCFSPNVFTSVLDVRETVSST